MAVCKRLVAILLLAGLRLAFVNATGFDIMRPRCLRLSEESPHRELQNLSIGDVKRPLRILAGDWASSRLLAESFSILVREMLGIDTAISYATSSGMCAEKLALETLDISLEIWETWARAKMDTLDESVRPYALGSPGFSGYDGLLLPKSVVNNATPAGVILEFHRTYDATSKNVAARYFSSYDDVLKNIAGREDEVLLACSKDEALISSSFGKAKNYKRHMADPGGTFLVDGVEQFKCSGPGAAVWYSPACRSNISNCIPVVSHRGYGLTGSGLAQKYVSSNMPVAVINFQGSYANSVVKASDVLFYSWMPDAGYSSVDPVKVVFPSHRPLEWANGLTTSDQIQDVILKMARKSFEADVPADIVYLSSRFMMSMEQVMESLKAWPKESNIMLESQVACSWARANNATWTQWKLHVCPEASYAPANGNNECLPCLASYYCPSMTEESNMMQFFQCLPGYSCPQGSAAPQKCRKGSYSNESGAVNCTQCPQGKSTDGLTLARNESVCQNCALGKHWSNGVCRECRGDSYADTLGALDCKMCKSWLGMAGANDDNSGCTVKSSAIVVVASIAILILLLVFLAFALRHRLRSVALDEPDRPESKTGSWVSTWAGSGPSARLRKGRYRARLSFARQLSPMSPMSPTSSVDVAWSEGKQITQSVDLFDSTFASSFTARMSTLASTDGKSFIRRNSTKLWRKCQSPAWIINASPFSLGIAFDSGTFKWDCRLDPEVFVKGQNTPPTSMTLTLTNSGSILSGLADVTPFETTCIIEDADWVQHNSDSAIWITRSRLPDQDGHRMGDIKLVWHRRNGHALKRGANLLISWSPPHIYRGVPLDEFESFLTKVLKHKGDWDKKKGKDRNMYDACKHIVLDEAAHFDWSYAEAHTSYGAADIFISHVWGETVQHTKQALTYFQDMLQSPDPVSDRSSARKPSLARCQSSASLLQSVSKRIWFCTICNNQVRVVEELGEDVNFSPFAQVLRSASCKTVALISPLKALERKWCNYEFCFSANLGMDIFMVTPDGVVEAGQVAPKALKELSQKVVSFSCRDATCTSTADEELIDKAVADMGGYDALDFKLKAVFHREIHEAFSHAEEAKNILSTDTSFRKSQEELVSGDTPCATVGALSKPPKPNTSTLVCL